MRCGAKHSPWEPTDVPEPCLLPILPFVGALELQHGCWVGQRFPPRDRLQPIGRAPELLGCDLPVSELSDVHIPPRGAAALLVGQAPIRNLDLTFRATSENGRPPVALRFDFSHRTVVAARVAGGLTACESALFTAAYALLVWGGPPRKGGGFLPGVACGVGHWLLLNCRVGWRISRAPALLDDQAARLVTSGLVRVCGGLLCGT